MSPAKRPKSGYLDTQKTSRVPPAHKASLRTSRRPVPRLREHQARRQTPSPARSDKGNSSFGGKSEFERRNTGENRKGPPCTTDSIPCRERSVSQHRQLSAHPTRPSPARSEWWFWNFGRNSEFFVPKNRKNSLFAKKRRGRHSPAHTMKIVLSAATTRIDRSTPQLDQTKTRGVLAV